MHKYPALHRAIVSALDSARERAGLSQRKLSVKLDEPVNYIHKIETLEHEDPTVVLADALKRARGIRDKKKWD